MIEKEIRVIDISNPNTVRVVISNSELWVVVDDIGRIRVAGDLRKSPDGGSTQKFTIEDQRS